MLRFIKYHFIGLLLILSLLDLKSQCTPPRADICDDAAVLCGLSAMNGYMCKNADYPNTQGPPSLCPGWGPPTNIGWWAFVTTGGNVCITVTYNNCTFPPPGGTNGIQLGIYEDCSFGNLIICDATCPGAMGTKQICGNLAACKPYYFFVDGCNGDVCDFKLTTTGGASPTLDPIGKINNDADQKIEVCKGACKYNFNVKAQKAGCEATYKWTLDGNDLGVNSNKISLDWPDEGSFILCAEAIIGTKNSICDKAGPECATIIVKKLDDKKGGPYNICPEKVPFNWHGEIIDMSGSYRKEFRDANCCYFDSVVDVNILPVPVSPDFYFIGCGPNDVFKDPITGIIYNTCQSQSLIKLPGSTMPFGCDSSYYLSAIFLKFNAIFVERCAEQQIEISPNIVNQTKLCGGGETFSFTYKWYEQTDPNKKPIGTDEKVLVTKKGEYCLELTVESKLGTKTQNCKFDLCENLDENKFNLNKICPIGDTITCTQSIDTFFIDTPAVNTVKTHFWTVTNGTILTPNPNDSGRIAIKWSSTPGKGKLCYSFSNDCGTGPECCYEIIINDAPHPNAGVDQKICGLTSSFSGTKDKNGSWKVLISPGNSFIEDSTDDHSNISVDRFGTYSFLWIETLNSCIGVDTVNITFYDSPAKDKDIILCNGNNSDYKIQFKVLNGTAPFVITKGSGSIDFNNIYTSGNILNNIKDTIIITDANGCSFTYIHEHECKCTNQIGVLDTLSESLCEDEVLHIIYDTTLQILNKAPDDTVIFFVYENPNDPFGSKIIILNALDLMYTTKFVFNQQYYVGAYLGRKNNNGGIDINQGCVQITRFGKPFKYLQIPFPSAGVDSSICGTSFTLSGLMSLTNSTIIWNTLANRNALILNPDSSITSVTILGIYGKYSFELTESNQDICFQKDSVEIEFFQIPEIINISKECVDLNAPGKYIVKASLLGGKAPYSLLTGSGKIVNDIWYSDTLTSLDKFNIQIIDSNGCVSEIISDLHNCNCGVIDAGKLDTNLTILCEDQCFNIKNAITEQVNPSEDVVMYVLHTGFFKNSIDTFYNINDNICFDKNKMMLGANNIYYISRVVGDDKLPKDGVVDSNDPCLRVSNNQSVIWIPYPQIEAGQKDSVCGTQYTTNAFLNIGIGTWTMISGPDISNISNSNQVNTLIEVNQNGNYKFLWEVTNGNCIQRDTLELTFLDAPSFSNNVRYICDSLAENYKIVVSAQNGDRSSWNIGGNANQTFPINGQFNPSNPSEWISDWIPSSSSFTLRINDKNKCNTDTISGNYTCPCITTLGKLDQTPIELCQGSTAYVNYNPINSMLDGNDILWFVLYDGNPSNPINGIVLQENSTGIFTFDPAKIQLNKKYYIAAIIGSKNANGNVNFTDRCLQYSVVEVIWHSQPTATISGNNILNCKNKMISLSASGSQTGSGTNPYFEWTSASGHFVDTTKTRSAQVEIDQPGFYQLTVIDSFLHCRSTVIYEIKIDTTPPSIQIANPGLITCKDSIIVLDASASSSGSKYDYQWSGPGIQGASNSNKINTIKAGKYFLTIMNTDNGCIDSAEIIVSEDKVLPAPKILQIGILGCANTQVNLDGSSSTSPSGIIDQYQWSSISGQINTDSSSSKITIGKPGGVFILKIRDKINGCFNTDTIRVQEIQNPLKEMILDSLNPSCFGEIDGEIEIISVLDSNNVPIQDLQFSLNGSSFSGKQHFFNLKQGTYSVLAKDKNGCIINRTITIQEPSKLSISVVRQKVVNQGDIVHLDSLLIGLFGGTSFNKFYKDTIWFNIDDQVDWEQKLTYIADKNRDFIITGIDQADCEVTDHIKILVRVVRDVWWPNIFSPNGDGSNDYFNIFGKNIKEIKSLSIFDRWGNKVYQKEHLPVGSSNNTDGWNGTFHGELVLPGVYTFISEVEFEGNNSLEIVAGEVTLIR